MSRGTAFISLLFSWHASVASVMPVDGEYAETMSGLLPPDSTVPRMALPSTQIISMPALSLSSLA